ncbi:MAG: phosphoesterase [Chitinophagales bacterium]|nr:MAG: phosphoesterase [Chitinophagales bacterium]
MKIGLLSDTHGHLPEVVFRHFANCDEIWHAGDFGSPEVADKLASFKPLRGVYGNIDGNQIRQRFPEELIFEIAQMKFLITHIAGQPGRYTARIQQLLAMQSPHVLICGHSHMLKVMFDKKFNLLYLNPGAAGNEGFHKIKTLLRFDILGNKLSNLEVIELGKRGTSQ